MKDEWVRGDPGSFGLLCFGMTTCMLMFITTRWAEPHFLPTVSCYAMFYGGLGQLVAGILELIKGNTFGGTAFASYGAFWMGWFLLEYLTRENPKHYVTAATGKTLWCGLWAFLTAGFFVVTLRKNGCLMTIFSTLVITFSLLAGGVWDPRCAHAAGYFGFFCGSSAIYAAFAFLYKIELGIVLPGVLPVNYLPGLEHPNAIVKPAASDGAGVGARPGSGDGVAARTVGQMGSKGKRQLGTGGLADKVGQDRAAAEPRGGSGRSGGSSGTTPRSGGGCGGGSGADSAAASGAPSQPPLPLDVV